MRMAHRPVAGRVRRARGGASAAMYLPQPHGCVIWSYLTRTRRNFLQTVDRESNTSSAERRSELKRL